jgi:hypothetical protein
VIRFILRTLFTPSEDERERVLAAVDRVRKEVVDGVVLVANDVADELRGEVDSMRRKP